MPTIPIRKSFPLLIFLSINSWSFAQDSVNIPANPCPSVFSYVKDQGGNIMGQITLPNNGEGYINVEINVSLATNTNSPKVELVRLDQDLTDCKPSIFNLHLPFSNNIPRVTRIFFNGDLLCSGPKEPLIAGGRTVWNLWRQSSYETSQRFTCKSQDQTKPPEIKPPSKNDLGFFLNIGNVDLNNQLFNQNLDFNTAFNNLPRVPSNTFDTNPFLTGRFPESSAINPTTPPPFQNPATSSSSNQCGISQAKSHITNLSFGGAEVPEGEFPWMAALMYKNPDTTVISMACTVTLVSLRYVVTRGHCLDNNGDAEVDKADLLVVLGARDVAKWFVDSVVRDVSNFYLKPGILPSRASHDVGLIQMSKRVDYIPGKVVPICMWSGRSDLNENDLAKLIDLNPGTVLGWGTTNTTTTNLNKISVPVINHLTCIQSSSLPADKVEANTFCGGYNDGQTGTCDTDAGAAFCVQKNRGGPWFLRGILSITPSISTSECNLKGYSLYTDLAEHYDWMYNIIKRDGL